MEKNLTLRRKTALLLMVTMLFHTGSAYAVYAADRQTDKQAEDAWAKITWQRSSEEPAAVTAVQERKWDWDTAGSIKTPVTDITKIWDAPYVPYYKGYTGGSSIHSSATWKTQNKVDLRRFTGTFKIPEGYTTEDFIRMQSVNQEAYGHLNNGNIVPINDNIYIFVYPEDIKDLISNDKNSPYYYMNYMAFWTGTANRTQAGISTFHGAPGTYAVRDKNKGPKVTDGWYAHAVIDNIGTVMHKTTGGMGEGTSFVLDIFTEDNSPGGGGGMDEMMLLFTRNPKAQVIAKEDIYAMPSGKTTLVQTSQGLLANDSPDQVLTSTILEGMTGEFNCIRENGRYYLYKNGQLAGKITYADAKGQFQFEPEKDYTGLIQFKYQAQDKLGKTSKAQVSLYIMPRVQVKHIDLEDNTELKPVSTSYGNPYKNLPDQTIYLNGTQGLSNKLKIERPAKLSSLYQFETLKITDTSTRVYDEIPYEYQYTESNAQIIAGYKKQDSTLVIEHMYQDSNDEDYKEVVKVRPGAKIQVSEYTDTTVQGKYKSNEKYQTIEIILQSLKEPSQSLNLKQIAGEKVDLSDFIEISGGSSYSLTYKYEFKKYTLTERHIYKETGDEYKNIIRTVSYGDLYELRPENIEQYEITRLSVDGKNYTGSDKNLYIQDDTEVVYYYEKKISDKEETPDQEQIPDQGDVSDKEEMPDQEEASDTEERPDRDNELNQGEMSDQGNIPADQPDTSLKEDNPKTKDPGINGYMVSLGVSVLGLGVLWKFRKKK